MGSSASGTASASAASPTVTGPVGGGTPAEDMFSTNFDLAKVGYQEKEFFVSGTASSYTSASPLTTDGKWTVTPDATAPYTTRVVVRRPVNPAKFNGTVIVEWLNVSGTVDAGPDWTLTHNELIRDGFAWVGVSAQQAGVNAAQGKNQVAPGRSGSVRRVVAPRRQLLVRHLLAGRAGDPRQRRADVGRLDARTS